MIQCPQRSRTWSSTLRMCSKWRIRSRRSIQWLWTVQAQWMSTSTHQHSNESQSTRAQSALYQRIRSDRMSAQLKTSTSHTRITILRTSWLWSRTFWAPQSLSIKLVGFILRFVLNSCRTVRILSIRTQTNTSTSQTLSLTSLVTTWSMMAVRHTTASITTIFEANSQSLTRHSLWMASQESRFRHSMCLTFSWLSTRLSKVRTTTSLDSCLTCYTTSQCCNRTSHIRCSSLIKSLRSVMVSSRASVLSSSTILTKMNSISRSLNRVNSNQSVIEHSSTVHSFRECLLFHHRSLLSGRRPLHIALVWSESILDNAYLRIRHFLTICSITVTTFMNSDSAHRTVRHRLTRCTRRTKTTQSSHTLIRPPKRNIEFRTAIYLKQ